MEKLEDLVNDQNSTEGEVLQGEELEKSPRCGSLGAKDLENLRNPRTKACQMNTQNRRFRMETTESW